MLKHLQRESFCGVYEAKDCRKKRGLKVTRETPKQSRSTLDVRHLDKNFLLTIYFYNEIDYD